MYVCTWVCSGPYVLCPVQGTETGVAATRGARRSSMRQGSGSRNDTEELQDGR